MSEIRIARLEKQVKTLQEQMERAFLEIEKLHSQDYTGERTK